VTRRRQDGTQRLDYTRYALITALVLGAALRWQALSIGFYLDDYVQRAQLAGSYVVQRPAWDLFWFGPRDAAEHGKLVDFGFLPWWSAEHLRVSMWRPLASALIWLDATLFGAVPWPAHVHSLAWWGLLVIAASRLLSWVLPPSAAAAATLLFALDEAHNVPLSWLANRNTLVAAALGCFALRAHLAAREHGSRAAVGVAALSWTSSLAAGEYAFGMLAYAAAYELWRGRSRPTLRAASLVALGVPVIAYLGSRALLGHAVQGSGYYVEPTELRYLSLLPGRALAAVSELGFGLNAGWMLSAPPARDWLMITLYERGWLSPGVWQALPDWRTLQAILGVIALGVLLVIARALGQVRGDDTLPAERSANDAAPAAPSTPYEHLPWLLLGSVLSVLASCGALPSSRLLVSAELGAAALLGSALVVLTARAQRASARRGAAIVALLALVVAHLAVPVRADVRELQGRHERARTTWRRALVLPLPHDASEAQHVDAVLVGATDFGTEVMLPWMRQLHGLSVPRRWQRLSGAPQAHDLRRLDDHTLELRVLATELKGAFAGSLHRTADRPITAGQRFAGGGFVVHVLEARDGNPARFTVRFERALDDPALWLLHAFPEGMRRLRVPPVGETLRLPVASQPWTLR
jgi:hypothetical protein